MALNTKEQEQKFAWKSAASASPSDPWEFMEMLRSLDLEMTNDPNDDGRVRFQELFDNFSYNPLAIFDTQGLPGKEIGVKLIFFFTKKFAIYRTPKFELFRLDIEGGTSTTILCKCSGRRFDTTAEYRCKSQPKKSRSKRQQRGIHSTGWIHYECKRSRWSTEGFSGITLITGDSGEGNDYVDGSGSSIRIELVVVKERII